MTKEQYEIMAEFEKLKLGRLDKEPKDLWRKQRIYQNGFVNKLFITYWHGYVLGKLMEREIHD